MATVSLSSGYRDAAGGAASVEIEATTIRELLMSDSVHIVSNITFDNLAPLSTYLGKPGDPSRGGRRCFFSRYFST